MTGETTATRFFNGKNRGNVDKGLNTFDKMMYPSNPENMNKNKKMPPVDDYNSGASNRNGSRPGQSKQSKADVLSQALGQVIQEKRSRTSQSANPDNVSVVSRSTVLTNRFMKTAMNA